MPGLSIRTGGRAEAGEAAADRFRALAEAYHVLADPARRMSYDRTLERQQPASGTAAPPVRVPVRHLAGRAWPVGASPLAPASAAPLRAGPVRVEGPHPAPGDPDEAELRLAMLAELALRYLAREEDWPW